MKYSKVFFYFVFLYVSFYLVLPPVISQLINRKHEINTEESFISVLVLLLISIFIYIFSLNFLPQYKNKKSEKKSIFIYTSNTLLSFGMLILISVFLETIGYCLRFESTIQKVNFPDSFFGTLKFIIQVFVFAFYEEVIYRFYLPEVLKKIFSRKKENINPKLSVIFEIIPIILFALGHIYLGILGFINAILCGTVLRICLLKTGSIWSNYTVHSAYNIISFIMIYLLF